MDLQRGVDSFHLDKLYDFVGSDEKIHKRGGSEQKMETV